MPTDYFKSTINARVDNSNQRANIEKYQNELTDKENTRNFIFELFEGALALLIAIPAGIYAFFGREPKSTMMQSMNMICRQMQKH